MRRTYRSKKETGDGLDPRDLVNAVDSKGSLFDAFYIQNIKETKRELTISSIQPGASKKVGKRKYAKRLKEQNPVQDLPFSSTYLTPDKSIHVKKTSDLFDQIFNSSDQLQNHSQEPIKAPELFDKLLNSSVQKHPNEPTKTSDLFDKLLNSSEQKHPKESIEASDIFDKILNESVQKHSKEHTEASVIFDKLLNSSKKLIKESVHKHSQELLNEYVEEQSKAPINVKSKISKKLNKRYKKKPPQSEINYSNEDDHKKKEEINELSELSVVVSTGKENISPNCSASIEEIVRNFTFAKVKQKNVVALSNSPLCSTPVHEKYRGQSIYRFSPIVKNLNEHLEDIESEEETNKPYCKNLSKGSYCNESLEDVFEEKTNEPNCKNNIEADMFIVKSTDGEENSVECNFINNSMQDVIETRYPVQSKERFKSPKKDSILNNSSQTSHLEPFLGFSNVTKNNELEDILRKYKEIQNNISYEGQSSIKEAYSGSILYETEGGVSVSPNKAKTTACKEQKNIGIYNKNPQNLSVVTLNSESIVNATQYDTCNTSEDFEDNKETHNKGTNNKEIVVVIEKLNDSMLQKYYDKNTVVSLESISKIDCSDSESCSSIDDTNSSDNYSEKDRKKKASCSSINEAKTFCNYVPTKDSEDKIVLSYNTQIETDIAKLHTSKRDIFISSDFSVTDENNHDVYIQNATPIATDNTVTDTPGGESCSILDYVNISDNISPRNKNEDIIDLVNCTQVALDKDKIDLSNSVIDAVSPDRSLMQEYLDKTYTDTDTYTSTESDSEGNKSDDQIYVSFVNTRRRNNVTKSYRYSENSYTSCCSTILEDTLLDDHKRNLQNDELTTNEAEEENDEIRESITTSIDTTLTQNNQNAITEKTTNLRATDRKSYADRSTDRKSYTNLKRTSRVRKSHAENLQNNRNSEVNDSIIVIEKNTKQRRTIKANTSDMVERQNLCLGNGISTCEVKQGIVLQPGKRWERSLSIYRRMSVMADHFDESTLHEEPLEGKGRKYRQSVISTMQMQDMRGSLHNESIQSRRSTLMFKPHRSTISIIRESTSSRRTSSASLDDLQGFLTEDCDDTIVELSKLSIGDSEHEVTVLEKFHDTSNRIATARDYVLRRCNQPDVVLFDECYPDTVLKNCRKIGEGVYGEVFLWRAGDGRARVLKIVPIAGDVKVNGEQQKDYHEIISEIVIAMELSTLRAPIPEIESHLDEGAAVETLDLHSVVNATDVFNEVLAAHIVYGTYPSRLLDLWELYDETKGSENDNPAVLPVDQQFLVLELANAGQDLESYQFNNAEQAYALFQQVAFGLAVGEEAFEFEHRDLHWGNVLIAPTDQKYATFVLRGRSYRVPRRGVAATIIDYSLSRVALPLGPAGAGERAALYNDLAADEVLFDAVGDYQFQVYRLMRDKLGNEWKNFEPYTNILWLHYTVDKMITALRYTRTNTKIHKHYIAKLKGIKNRILDYGSAVQYVLTDNEI